MITFKKVLVTWEEAMVTLKESKPLRVALKSFDIARLYPIEATVAKVFPQRIEPWMTKPRPRPSTTLVYPLVHKLVYEFEKADNGVVISVFRDTYVWITRKKDLLFKVDDMFYSLNVFWAAEYLAAEGQSYERLLAVLRDDQEKLKEFDETDRLEPAYRLMQLINGN